MTRRKVRCWGWKRSMSRHCWREDQRPPVRATWMLKRVELTGSIKDSSKLIKILIKYITTTNITRSILTARSARTTTRIQTLWKRAAPLVCHTLKPLVRCRLQTKLQIFLDLLLLRIIITRRLSTLALSILDQTTLLSNQHLSSIKIQWQCLGIINGSALNLNTPCSNNL
jgi:hypothetical protein